MIAPEPYFSACMAVLSEALMRARRLATMPTTDPTHLRDMMDAVHNIPTLVGCWERGDPARLRTSFLQPYDAKWAIAGGFSMCTVFDHHVERLHARRLDGSQPLQ